MDWWLIVLRIVHVGSAMVWFGGAIIGAFFLAPTAAALGKAGQPFMEHVMRRRRLGVLFPIVGALTVLAGAGLYWRDSDGLQRGVDHLADGPGVHRGRDRGHRLVRARLRPGRAERRAPDSRRQRAGGQWRRAERRAERSAATGRWVDAAGDARRPPADPARGPDDGHRSLPVRGQVRDGSRPPVLHPLVSDWPRVLRAPSTSRPGSASGPALLSASYISPDRANCR